MVLDQNIRDLDDNLDRVKDQVLRDLLAKGHRLHDINSRVSNVNDQVRTQFAGSPTSNQQLSKDVTDTFITLVMAHGLRLSAKLVSNTLAVKGQLNNSQAICLWLGLFFDQSGSCEGLWQTYVDYRSIGNGAPLEFPEFVSKVCGYIDATDEDVLQDLIPNYWEDQIDLANQALRVTEKVALRPSDIPKLIAWILATKLDEKTPQEAIEDIGRGLVGVHNDLRRGYHTLLGKHLEDIYMIIDAK